MLWGDGGWFLGFSPPLGGGRTEPEIALLQAADGQADPGDRVAGRAVRADVRADIRRKRLPGGQVRGALEAVGDAAQARIPPITEGEVVYPRYVMPTHPGQKRAVRAAERC